MTAQELVEFIQEHCLDAKQVLVPDGWGGHIPAIPLSSPNFLVLIPDPDHETSTG